MQTLLFLMILFSPVPEALDLLNPAGMTVAADGHIFVTEGGECQVLVFDEEGQLVRKFGQKGQGPGEFGGPCALGFMPSGELAVLDFVDFGLHFFKPDGEFLRKIRLDKAYSHMLILDADRILLARGMVRGLPFSFRIGEASESDLGLIINAQGEKIKGLGTFKESNNPMIDVYSNQGSWTAWADRIWMARFGDNQLLLFEHGQQKEMRFKSLFEPDQIDGKTSGKDGSYSFQVTPPRPVVLGLAALEEQKLLMLRATGKQDDDVPLTQLIILNDQGEIIEELSPIYRAITMAVHPDGSKAYLLQEEEEGYKLVKVAF